MSKGAAAAVGAIVGTGATTVPPASPCWQHHWTAWTCIDCTVYRSSAVTCHRDDGILQAIGRSAAMLECARGQQHSTQRSAVSLLRGLECIVPSLSSGVSLLCPRSAVVLPRRSGRDCVQQSQPAVRRAVLLPSPLCGVVWWLSSPSATIEPVVWCDP